MVVVDVDVVEIGAVLVVGSEVKLDVVGLFVDVVDDVDGGVTGARGVTAEIDVPDFFPFRDSNPETLLRGLACTPELF